MKLKRYWQISLLLAIVVFSLACRTAETLAALRSRPTSPARVATSRATRIAGGQQPQVETPTAILAITDEPVEPPTDEPPAQVQPQPVQQPTVARPPTIRPAPRQVQPTARPPDTAVPQPTAVPFKYRIQESRCGPNVRTYIEGTVYEGSVGKNDVLVRISQGPDGGPDPNDDYRTGTDPRRKGYYYHNIDANAPHAGTWYVWVLDKDTMQRISEIAIVKTDPQRVEDSGTSAGSCQSATVNFSTGGSQARPSSTPRPTNTVGSTQPTQTPRPTQDPGNDS